MSKKEDSRKVAIDSGFHTGKRTPLTKVKGDNHQAENYYQTLFENSPEGILIVDLQKGRALDVNPQLPRLFQVEEHRLLNGNMLEFSPEFQADGKESSKKLREHLDVYRSTGRVVHFEWQFRRGAKELFDAWVTISPMIMNGREVSVLFIRDVSQAREAERALEQKIVELDEKNRQLEKYIQSNLELENFAYIASHDLREPLRTIMGFSQLLQQRYQKELPAQAQEYLSMVIESVENMNLVTMDLLEYSRVNSQEYKRENIKVKELIQRVLTMLDQQITEKAASIEFGSLPENIVASKSQLTKVFQNLISNGIKFQKKDQKPRIHISGRTEKSKWSFYVKDNGIGIDEKYHDKIFLIFKRLHHRSDYKGSGIGLAIVKKIIEKHGGEIAVESKLGEGTTFSFTLAKNHHTNR